MKEIAIHAINPPVIDSGVFFFVGNLAEINLYVPSSAKDAYKGAAVWREFNIRPNKFIVSVESADKTMGSVTGSGEYYYYEEATIEAIANKNYRFVQWSDGNKANPRTIATPEDDITLTAEFEAMKYMVTVEPNDNSMGVVFGGKEYVYNSEATIGAVPNQGYRFVQWNDGNTDNPRTFTVTEDVTFTAEFAKDNGTAVDNQVEDSIAVTAGNGVITVYGAEGETVSVYNMQGVCIYSAAGNDPTEVTVPVSGIYLVKVKDKTVKVSVR